MMSLVDWRWARAKGYYDGSRKEWNEAKGGMGGYLKDAMARREKKKKNSLKFFSQRPASADFRVARSVAQPRQWETTGSSARGGGDGGEGGGGVLLMNLGGLEPIDLFGGGAFGPFDVPNLAAVIALNGCCGAQRRGELFLDFDH
jgi:hypothetical protein